MGLFGKKQPALREASVESIGEALSTQGLAARSCRLVDC